MLLEMHLQGQPKQKTETLFWLVIRSYKTKNNSPEIGEQMLPLLPPHVLVRMTNSVLDDKDETLNQPLLHVLTKTMYNASYGGEQTLT